MSRRRFLLLVGLGGAGAATCAGGAFWLVNGQYIPAASPDLIATLASQRPELTGTVDPPAIIARADWGALPPDHEAMNERGFYSPENPEGWQVYDASLPDVYHTAVLHHPGFYELNDTNTVLSIQRFQREVRHWADVAYHYFVGRSGAVFEGRPINVRGTHVREHNTGSVGICLLGNFTWQTPSEAQILATQQLIRWLAVELQLTHLAGHRDFNHETECPGSNLIPYLNALASSTGLILGPTE